MEIRFIGQGYNIDLNTSMARELITAINNGEYNSFICLVAFASYGGVSGLTSHIQGSSIDKIKIIVGIDQECTSIEALKEILAWGVESYVYHSRSPNIFHPKIYLFEGEHKSMVIVGSHNLTEFGLAKNIESSLLISFSKDDDTNDILTQIQQYFENILNNNDKNLILLSYDLIKKLAETGKIPSEEHRKKLYDRKPEESSTGEGNKHSISDLFGTIPMQRNPDGFSPKRIKGIKDATVEIEPTIDMEPSTLVAAFTDSGGWFIAEDSPVLVAQIGKGERWKQVNFPINIFTDFFGASRGDNSYHIKLKHIAIDGSFDEEEDRQAVTVASQNYRFEIGAAKGSYPASNMPISIFVKVESRRFLYHLIMPDATYFDSVYDFLNQNYSGPTRNLKRVQTNYQHLKDNCNDIPF
jgi:HKD family nuclease